ncbi:hypothetical protein Tco_0878413 [Tanacetum coccineum]|uniref:Uncharacterized protein n=1 Tax=Tanacetum coccineum TaxID=301880 RepID=A0ABQ5C142_9ASTR
MSNVKKSVAERTRHQRQYDRRVNKRQMQTQESKIDTSKALDASLVIMECSGIEFGKQDTSNRPQISKSRFASQVDVKKDLSKPVTQHYLPKGRESAFAKPYHVIASSESRNSSKNMSRFSSNDMVHNYYLEEDRKKIQERNWNSKSSVMHTASPQNTTNGSKPKPRSNNQTSRSFLVSKSSCVMLNVVPLVDHSRIPSPFSDSKHFIFIGHRFSPNKSSVGYEKTSPRSCLRWKPTGRIFNNVGLRWIPTGKLLDSCTGKVDSELPHGSSVDVSKIHEYKQTLDLRVVVSKSTAVTTTDASDKRQQQPDSTSSTSTLATTVTADGNFDLYIFLFFSLF